MDLAIPRPSQNTIRHTSRQTSVLRRVSCYDPDTQPTGPSPGRSHVALGLLVECLLAVRGAEHVGLPGARTPVRGVIVNGHAANKVIGLGRFGCLLCAGDRRSDIVDGTLSG